MENLSEHNAWDGKKIINPYRKILRSALNEAGYSHEMISDDVGFVGEGGKPFTTDMVAYSSILRHDADTAVISLKGTEDTEKILFDPDISPFRALATPIVVLSEYKAIRGKDEPRVITFGLSRDAETFNLQKEKSKIIPLSRFKDYLRDNQEYFTPRRLEKAKLVPEQLTLFDIAPNLLRNAIDIVDKELIDRFEKGVREIIHSIDPKPEQEVIKGAISLLGARILRDRMGKNWPLGDGTKVFLSHAQDFLPGYFNVSEKNADLLDPLLRRLNASLNFSQVSLDMVGKFYESAFVTKELRKRWGIHYTKSLLAKTLLSRIPIEELPPEKRILADPTCGSGSLLTAGYERLASASYLRVPQDERHRKLVESIFGNDKDSFAAEVARMTLMLFHPPHQNNWKVTRFDIEDDNFIRMWKKEVRLSPSIIVANPPFGGISGDKSEAKKPRTRHQKDRSALILNRCLDILPEGGLLGIILTDTILDQIDEKITRHRVVRECRILEQWDVPTEWFVNVDRPAMAWVLRKTAPLTKTVFARTLSDVPSHGQEIDIQETIRIDVDNPPDNLVPTIFDDILSQMEASPNHIKDYYITWNGLQPLKGKVTTEKSQQSHPWSDNAKGTDPYSDFSDGRKGWLELSVENFLKKSPRTELRKHLEENESMVMFRANRTAPWIYKWSSIALIDVADNSRKVVAPSVSFHASFSRSENELDRKKYIYSLWAILNHPLASLWFHERQRGNWVPIYKYHSEFPLPKSWDIKTIKSLASIAKKLLCAKREIDSKPFFRSQGSKEILEMVKEIDEIIFEMYKIEASNRRSIKAWLGEESHPLLKSIYHRKAHPKISNDTIRISYEEPEWETTCETLEVHLEKKLIRLAIDGLNECVEDAGSIDDAITLKIIPAMPGWLLEKGAVGWIELTTNSARKLNQSPEKYVIGFRLHKNAYKTQDEIDKTLRLTFTSKMEKAETNG